MCQGVEKESSRRLQRELKAAEEALQKKCVQVGCSAFLAVYAPHTAHSYSLVLCRSRYNDQKAALKRKFETEKADALRALRTDLENRARSAKGEADSAYAKLLRQLKDTEQTAAAAAAEASAVCTHTRTHMRACLILLTS